MGSLNEIFDIIEYMKEETALTHQQQQLLKSCLQHCKEVREEIESLQKKEAQLEQIKNLIK